VYVLSTEWMLFDFNFQDWYEREFAFIIHLTNCETKYDRGGTQHID